MRSDTLSSTPMSYHFVQASWNSFQTAFKLSKLIAEGKSSNSKNPDNSH